MASDVNELTINYEEDGVLMVKEIDKEILSKGAWATILFRYQQWDSKKNEYSGDKYSIRRYRKKDGEYMVQGKFNISSADQATKIATTLQRWLK